MFLRLFVPYVLVVPSPLCAASSLVIKNGFPSPLLSSVCGFHILRKHKQEREKERDGERSYSMLPRSALQAEKHIAVSILAPDLYNRKQKAHFSQRLIVFSALPSTTRFKTASGSFCFPCTHRRLKTASGSSCFPCPLAPALQSSNRTSRLKSTSRNSWHLPDMSHHKFKSTSRPALLSCVLRCVTVLLSLVSRVPPQTQNRILQLWVSALAYRHNGEIPLSTTFFVGLLCCRDLRFVPPQSTSLKFCFY